MALSYEESAALMTDQAFRGRIKVACIKFADFIQLEAASEAAHNTRVKWAHNALAQPEAAAQQVAPVVVMDPSVQESGADVTDAALQSAVEASVNKML